MKKQELLKVYRTFWMEFEKICRSAGAISKPSDGATIQLDEAECTNKQSVITALCYFPEWRYRSQSPRERVHIAIQSRETYANAESRLVRSSVHVLYWKLSGSKGDPLLGLHYDFVSPSQLAHPVFHAQFGTRDFDLEELEGIGFSATMKPLPQGTLYANVRIPTPCMNFVSVLLGLAADHLEPQFFDQVLKLVRKSQLTKWDATCQALEGSIRDFGGYLPSHHWYEAVPSQ